MIPLEERKGIDSLQPSFMYLHALILSGQTKKVLHQAMIFKCVVPYTNLITITGNQGVRETPFRSTLINPKITTF